jgi:carboxypeptidase family protein
MKRMIVQALAIAMVVSSLPVSAAGPVGRSAAAATGTILGLAASSSGQTLSNVTVHVRNLQSGAIAGSTTSNAVGRFSFAGINPGRYIVEVARQSAIVGSSSAVDVTAGSTVNVTVNTLAAANVAYGGAAQTGGGGGGVNKAVIITTIAVAAGVTTAIIIATNDKASPSR